MVCAGGNYGKLTKEDNYEGKFIALVGEGGRIYPIPWKNGKFPRPVRPALATEVQAATNIMGEEMPGLDEGTIWLELTTDSKGLQEARQVDNQLRDKGTAVDTAVLKRSVDMNTYISSQETSRHDHPTKQKACRNKSRQAFMYGQVNTGFQFLRVSKEFGTNVKTKILYTFTQ